VFSPGEKLPSESALVKRFGVSRITVGRALRELRERGLINSIAGSGSFVARPGPGGAHLLFGLIIPDLGDTEIFEPICNGMASCPEAAGHALLWPGSELRAGGSKEQQALDLTRQCIARGVAGAFFAPVELTERATEVNRTVIGELDAAGIAVVLLDRRPLGPEDPRRCDLAGLDNFRAGYIAADHLLKAGARQVAFLAREGQASSVKARIAGYREALIDHGHAAQGDLLFLGPREAAGQRAALSKSDAFVCSNDRLAGELMQSLLARKVRIPEDIRIVGVDDASYSKLLPVPLTTVHQPAHEIGEAAMRLMLERTSRPQTPARSVLLDCWLVVRESCGAALK
jgi:DNA-binding LacI/PurR family transcriptional regulator